MPNYHICPLISYKLRFELSRYNTRSDNSYKLYKVKIYILNEAKNFWLNAKHLDQIANSLMVIVTAIKPVTGEQTVGSLESS